ncbi:tail fiber assembly protein [Kluyvera intermedia]|uniref:tail fiber assembly protein n=1 Tax=Kluyvera intermedia TaxID=61648 RepID=UPI0035244FB6
MNFFNAVKTENISIEIIEGVKPFLVGASIDADGNNYYDFQKTITEKYACVVNTGSGRVRYLSEDASTIAPGAGESVFGIDDIPDDFFDYDFSYWAFNAGEFSPYQFTPAELTAIADSKKSRLMAVASAAIGPLQDADRLGIATDEEIAQLQELMRYRIDLYRTNTSMTAITWPPVPAFMEDFMTTPHAMLTF